MPAILDPSIDEGTKKQERTHRSKPIPPHAVIVKNDEDHTFLYVTETFQKVFGYDETKAFSLAQKIHEEGQAIVWTGTKEVAELKEEQIKGMGPDIYAKKQVIYPLIVEIRPLV